MSGTEAQHAALEQLWAITASDTTAARERDERLLRENGWGVQATVEQIFAMGASPSSSARPPPPIEQMEVNDSLSALPPPGARRLSGSRRSGRGTGTGGAGLGAFGLLAWPLTTLRSILVGAWFFFIRTFIPLSLLPHIPRFLLPPTGPPQPRARRDPAAESLAFVRELETLTGSTASSGSLPDFRVGSYRDFMTAVRTEGKVGLVVLVCGEHEDDEEFKRDVLCDQELVRCLKEKDIMVWGADVRSREGYQVAQTLLVTTYPALTFISVLPGPSGSSPRLSVLTTLSGPPSTTTSSSSILQTINNSVLPRTATYLARIKRERLAVEEARHLREEQDRAFRDAEKRDREKALVRQQKEEAERIKQDRAQREQQEKADLVEKRKAWRRYARKHLLPPSQGAVRVALRIPMSAERHIRQFEPGPSTLPLFIFAETLLIPPEDKPDADPDSPPDAYEPEWDFRIVTNYPRKEVERAAVGAEAQWDIVKGAGGALFAEKTEHGSWGEAERRALSGDSDDEEQED